MPTLREYLSSLLRHGWEESWVPQLSKEEIIYIAMLAYKELSENEHQ